MTLKLLDRREAVQCELRIELFREAEKALRDHERPPLLKRLLNGASPQTENVQPRDLKVLSEALTNVAFRTFEREEGRLVRAHRIERDEIVGDAASVQTASAQLSAALVLAAALRTLEMLHTADCQLKWQPLVS